ncbi:hypothetical protein LCGC14_0630480 [marine sediment metagenome]|uniref:Uncharacterized protein n=1 Tax=marine sediment metagenome TaxID=412755 RepID=A0A0F9R7B9_9ZZZZ
MLKFSKYAQRAAEEAADTVRESLEDTTDSMAGEAEPISADDIRDSTQTEEQRVILDQQRKQVLINAVHKYLQMPEYKPVSSAVTAEPEMQALFTEGNAYPLKNRIQEMGLEGAAAQLALPDNQLISDAELTAYFDRLKRTYEEQARMQETQQMSGPAVPGVGTWAFNLKQYKTAQQGRIQAPDPIDEIEKGKFVAQYLDILTSGNATDEQSFMAVEQAKEEIKGMVSPSLENDIVDALESIQVLDPISQKDKAARFLGQVYESFIAGSAYPPIETQPMEPVMSEKNPKGIIKFNLSDHVDNQPEAIEKTASAFQSQEYVLYGPSEKRICPKMKGKKTGGGDVVSEYICRHHCLDGIVIDDNKTICGEALWRANAMDKFSHEYVDEDGKIQGGYINKRFEVNHNVPEETNMRLKPGETRKPRPPEMGNYESRMQAMRKAEGEKRGYKPDTNTGDPFQWDKDVDQNNVEQTQATRDSREEAMGHPTVQYSEKPPTENNPKVAQRTKVAIDPVCPICHRPIEGSYCPRCSKRKKSFNLKHYKTAQFRGAYSDPGNEVGNWTGGWLNGEWKCPNCQTMIGRNLNDELPHLAAKRHQQQCQGHGETNYPESFSTSNSIIKTAEENGKFNLKRYKQSQIIPADGFADGGEPYTNEEMDTISEQPDEEDIFCNDPGGPFFYLRKQIANTPRELMGWMDSQQYFPDVWFISDHGNPHNITSTIRLEDMSPEVLSSHLSSNTQYKKAQSPPFEREKYDFASGEEKAQAMTSEALHHTIKDLRDVIKIQDAATREGTMHTPKLGYYFDELHTMVRELNRRQGRTATQKSETKIAQICPTCNKACGEEPCPRCGPRDQLPIEIRRHNKNQPSDQLAKEITRQHQDKRIANSWEGIFDKIAECPTPIPNDGKPVDSKEEKVKKDDDHSRKFNPSRKMSSQGFNLNQYKKAEKGVTYKGKHYKVNPWAACSANIDKKEEPEKHEDCVMYVKEKSKSSSDKKKS